MRSTIRFLVQHNLVDCVVVTAGGVEEDFVKCLAPTFLGDFKLKGSELRKKGINRFVCVILCVGEVPQSDKLAALKS